MRLVTLKSGGRDGLLGVVDEAGRRVARRPAGLETLQEALDDWAAAKPALEAAAAALEAGETDSVAFEPQQAEAPLPRAYQWAEASSYHVHMERIRKSRGIGLPPDHGKIPAAYNSGSDIFRGPTDPIELADVSWGLDLEVTLAVIVDDVPAGVTVEEAGSRIALVILVDDLTLRHLMPGEYARGVGFLQAKPTRPAAPFAVTPEHLGSLWDGHLLHAKISCRVNDDLLGELDSGADCAFDFPQVIAHLARTRPLTAGSVIGNGTVANRDRARGVGAIAERRALEITDDGEAKTEFLRPGDRVRIEATDPDGRSLFGAMDQSVVSVPAA